jgi:AcrR family transcriptional regulator
MSARTAARKDLKRTRILDAAKRRFGRFGIKATTMQEIARDADLAVGTIYQFFPDKDALVLAWVDEHRQLMHAQFAQVLAEPLPADEKLRAYVLLRFHTLRKMREEPAIAEIARAVIRLTPEAIPEMTLTALGHIHTILDEGRRSRCLPSAAPDEDADVFFHALDGFFPTVEDPIGGPPEEKTMLRVVDWFIAKWKQPRPRSRS